MSFYVKMILKITITNERRNNHLMGMYLFLFHVFIYIIFYDVHSLLYYPIRTYLVIYYSCRFCNPYDQIGMFYVIHRYYILLLCIFSYHLFQDRIQPFCFIFSLSLLVTLYNGVICKRYSYSGS